MTGYFRRHKRVFIWVATILVLLTIYRLNPGWFSIMGLERFVDEYRILIMMVYVLILSLLGLSFIPSTPFAIAGVLIFSPVEAYILNIVGILTSSTIVYYFAQFLRLSQVFEDKYPGRIKQIRGKLRGKVLPIIVSWSFFPLVPTDLIIYIASGMRIPLWKCLLGVTLGEGTLNFIYIFSAGALIS